MAAIALLSAILGGNLEDFIPEKYKYAWHGNSPDMPLQDFLTKYKPSMVQNDGTKPWIWVRSSKEKNPPPEEMQNLALKEAGQVLQEVTAKIEAVKNDGSIPVRSSKKTGAKSKKEVREQLQAEATEKFKEIGQKYGYVGGKWLIFAGHDKVDLIWGNIAKSLIEGPLADTVAEVTKVSTSPPDDVPNYQHVICLYIPDVYNKEEVLKVMNVLLRKHGCTLSGVKSDLYTRLGIDSKHPSGIQSTIWKNSALMLDADSKKLKEEFYAELKAGAPNAGTTKPTSTSESKDKDGEGSSTTAAKAKPKLVKKRKANDDPFASDDDEDEPPKKKASSKKK